MMETNKVNHGLGQCDIWDITRRVITVHKEDPISHGHVIEY